MSEMRVAVKRSKRAIERKSIPEFFVLSLSFENFYGNPFTESFMPVFQSQPIQSPQIPESPIYNNFWLVFAVS